MTTDRPLSSERTSRKSQDRSGAKAERYAATRVALTESAYELFGARGFNDVGTEEIVRAAGVTRGALYHHFRDKQDLFAAVFERVERESVAAVVEAVTGIDDPWRAAIVGSRAYLDFCLDPAVQRIAIVDSASVLSQSRRQEIARENGDALIRVMVESLVAAGEVKPQPVDAVVSVLTGALVEAAAFIARSADPQQASDDVAAVLEQMLEGLR